MIKITTQLFSLLTPNQRKRFYLLQFLVILMAFMEIIGVASIIPFMALVGDMTQLQPQIKRLKNLLEMRLKRNFQTIK